jgi:hypothetical protein
MSISGSGNHQSRHRSIPAAGVAPLHDMFIPAAGVAPLHDMFTELCMFKQQFIYTIESFIFSIA